MHKNSKDLIGQRFSKLVVLLNVGSSKDRQIIWNCLCDCGNTTLVKAGNLKTGNTKSCGCAMNDEWRKKISESRVGKARGELNGSWKGGKPKCGTCGVHITRGSIACVKHSKKYGLEHPAWVKNRDELKVGRTKSYDTKYKYWMLSVKKRDKWRCKIGSSLCKGRLEAHHILDWVNHPELRYNVNNGITLCHAHHPRKRSDEAKLSPFFQSLVAEMK